MWDSKSGGVVFTSVRIHPLKLLGIAITLGMVGAAAIRGGMTQPISLSILLIVGGLLMVAAACLLAAVSCKQINRAIRTFFS